MRSCIKKIAEAGLTLVVMSVFIMCYYVTKDINAVVTEKTSVATSASRSGLPEVLLDAGHGGFDGGCVGVNGEIEKGINLSITKSVYYLCSAFGYQAKTSRFDDNSLNDSDITEIYDMKQSDMKKRLEFFNSSSNAVCLSIHQNQFTDSQYWGAQMFFSNKNELNETLASDIQQSIVSNIEYQSNNTREIKHDDDMYVLSTENPSVMVECGFLSNEEEAAKLSDADYQKQIALSVFLGLNKFIGENYI